MMKWTIRRPTAAALVLVSLAATAAALVVWAQVTRRLEQEGTAARQREKEATEMKQAFETERNEAWGQRTEAKRQRDEAVRLLEFNLAAVRDHAKVVVDGKQGRVAEAAVTGKYNPGAVLYQLACAYARSARAFRVDASLAPEHAARLSKEYADSAMSLLMAAKQVGYFADSPICYKLDDQPELQELEKRPDFQQLRRSDGGVPKK
jgi:hypothetical protein